MQITLTINLGVTPQLAAFLQAALGGQTDHSYAEPLMGRTDVIGKAEDPERDDPFATGTAGAQNAATEQASSASATGASTGSAAATSSRKGSSRKSADKPAAPASGASDPFSTAGAGQATAGATAGLAADPFAGQVTKGAAAQGVGDPFSNQVKAAAAATEADEGAFTIKDLNDAAAAAMQKIKAAGVKGVLGQLTDAAGNPCDRLAAVQPDDFGLAISLLNQAAKSS